MSTTSRARSYYRRQQRIGLLGVRAVRRAVTTAADAESAQTAAVTALATYQLASAQTAAASMAAELGTAASSIPASVVGTTQLGWPIETPVETIIARLTQDLDGRWKALSESMLGTLDLFVKSEVIAAGADVGSVEVARADARFVRVLDLPSCYRCVILAGVIYRSGDAFARHPLCDCEHWPVGTESEARASGLVLDPMEAFDRGQVRGFSKAEEQAIRDGADMIQIANSHRGGGRRPSGMTNIVSADIFGRTVKATLEGTTSRANWRRLHPDLPIRLRPESIYEHARDRADALRLLRLYGYLT